MSRYNSNPDSVSYGFGGSFGSKARDTEYDYGDDDNGDYQHTNGNDSYGSNIPRADNHNKNETDDIDDPYDSSVTRDDDLRGSIAGNLVHPSTNQVHHTSSSDTYGSSNSSHKHDGPCGSENTHPVQPTQHASHNDERLVGSDGVGSNQAAHQTPAPHVPSNSEPAPEPEPSVTSASGSSASDLFASFDNRQKLASNSYTDDNPPHAAPNDEPHEERHAPPNDPSIPGPDPDTSEPPAQKADWLHKGVALAAQKAGHPIDDSLVDTIEGGLKKLGLGKFL